MRQTSTLLLVVGLVLALAVPATAKDPTCSGVVGDVHGHHIVCDYVTGV